MKLEPDASGKTVVEAESSQCVFRATNVAIAEHMRVILAMSQIPAAVIQRNPMHMVVALTDVIVSVNDGAKAQDALRAALESAHGADWNCPHCEEEAPGNFDLCWNCGALHPSLTAKEWAVPEESTPEPVA